MASMTIRNIEDETKQRLRIRAARHGASLEEEVRLILRRAAKEDDPGREQGDPNLYDAIRALVEPHGGFDLEIPERALPPGKPPALD